MPYDTPLLWGNWICYHTPLLRGQTTACPMILPCCRGRPSDALSYSLAVRADHRMPYHTPSLGGKTTGCPIILRCCRGRPPGAYHTPLCGQTIRCPIILPCSGGRPPDGLSYSLAVRADQRMTYHTPWLWVQTTGNLSYSCVVEENHGTPYHTILLWGQTTGCPIILPAVVAPEAL